jgi:hypothetical protein
MDRASPRGATCVGLFPWTSGRRLESSTGEWPCAQPELVGQRRYEKGRRVCHQAALLALSDLRRIPNRLALLLRRDQPRVGPRRRHYPRLTSAR